MSVCWSRRPPSWWMMKTPSTKTSSSISLPAPWKKPTIRSVCICARWASFRCSRAKAKCPSPSGSNADNSRPKKQSAVRRSRLKNSSRSVMIWTEMRSTFAEQAELTGDEDMDKAEEYRAWTVEGIENIRKLFKQGLKEWDKLREEQKATRGKKSKKVLRLRRKVARLRLEIAQEIGRLNLTERARQRLINAIRHVQKEVRLAEREIESLTEKLTKKRIRPDDQKEYKRRISVAKKRLQQIEVENNIGPVEIKRSLQAIVT